MEWERSFILLSRRRGNPHAFRALKRTAWPAAAAIVAAAAISVVQARPVVAASATWDGDSAVGLVGDGVSWGDANIWTTGGLVDTAPSSADDLTFGGGTVGPISFGGASRSANSLTFNSGFTLDPQGNTDTLFL